MSLIHRALVKTPNSSSATSENLTPDEKKKLDDLSNSPKTHVDELVFIKSIGNPASVSSSSDTELNDDEEDFTFPKDYPPAVPAKKPSNRR